MMADQNDFSGSAPGGDGQDVCSFFASIFSQRQSMERLINWLRESQTTCTDTNCFDDINGLPASGDHLVGLDGSSDYNGNSSEMDGFALVLWFVVGLLTLYAVTSNRDRNNNQSIISKEKSSPSYDDNGPNNDNNNIDRRRRDDDDHSRPAL